MIELYDPALHLMRPVDHALKIGYEQKLNELSTATLEVACEDEIVRNILVSASFARIRDGDEDLGFFRFASIPRDEHAPQGVCAYSLQSAECTLLDDLLEGWHEIGGTGISTRDVIEYILARQSTEGVQRWVLGECDFEDYYQFNFQDVTLLEAIMSLGETLLDDYQFVFDSTAEPWTMHLKRLGGEAKCSLVYRRSMTRFRRSVDGRVVTRLYGRGYGEGDNQLTIASVNGGKNYLDAGASAMRKYGVRCGVHVDTRQTDPATLKAHMLRILENGQHPTVSYEADAIDLARATGESWDRVDVGKKVLVLDEILGEAISVRVTSRRKDDVDGDPGGVSYVLDNSVADTAEELSEIRDKIGVHELYSQGATNMYSMQISENADASHPLVMRFYVPGNVLRINSCLMTWEIGRFRTHIKMAKSGGGSSRTSETGGGATVTLPAQTISTGVKYTSGPMDTDGGSAGYTGGPKDFAGSGKTTTDSGGSHDHEVAKHGHSFSDTYSLSWNHVHSGGSDYTGGVYDYSGKTISISGTTETVSLMTQKAGSHSHDFDHVHNMPHVHNMAHEHTIPALSFTLSGHSHTVEIPEHTHEMEYGIYEGSRAESLSIVVDGTAIPAEAIGEAREIDVAPYLRKNDEGKVRRSAWHEVEFVPSGLTRLTANLFFQVFIQSRGAGDY